MSEANLVRLPLEGEAGVEWLNKEGGRPQTTPSWPRSRRLALVAIVSFNGRPEMFYTIPRGDDLESFVIITLNGKTETNRCLFFHVPLSRLFALHPPLAAVEFEGPVAEGDPDVKS